MLLKLWDNFFQGDFISNGKDIYLAHYAEIRRLVPQERLLECHIENGWEPLCKFLGEEVPSIPFPCSNTIDTFVAGAAERNGRKLCALGLKAAALMMSVSVVGFGVVMIVQWLQLA